MLIFTIFSTLIIILKYKEKFGDYDKEILHIIHRENQIKFRRIKDDLKRFFFSSFARKIPSRKKEVEKGNF